MSLARQRALLALGAGSLVLGVATSCSQRQSSLENQASVTSETAEDGPLEYWRSGNSEDAVAQLVAWASRPDLSHSPLTNEISEQEFLQLPPAERNKAFEKLLDDHKTLRELAGAAIRKSEIANQSNRPEYARQILESLVTLGEVYQSPDLSRHAVMTGEAISRAAKKGLEQLRPG